MSFPIKRLKAQPSDRWKELFKSMLQVLSEELNPGLQIHRLQWRPCAQASANLEPIVFHQLLSKDRAAGSYGSWGVL